MKEKQLNNHKYTMRVPLDDFRQLQVILNATEEKKPINAWMTDQIKRYNKHMLEKFPQYEIQKID